MIIDLILDRKDGFGYDAKEFYNNVMGYGQIGFDITSAMDGGTNLDVQRELSIYILKNEYNHKLIDYVFSENWIE